MKTFKILSIISVALLTQFAMADDMQGMGKGLGRPAIPIFSDFDADKDNNLTEQEYYDARNKRIAKHAKEGRQMRGLANIASFADLDVNGDGKVTQNEFQQFISGHMRRGH